MPVLVDDGFSVWDTLAIAEYLGERFPGVWPADAQARARARSLCAEMHAGFGALRSHCPMNIEASLPEVGATVWAEQPAVRKNVARIEGMWAEALQASGGPFLFGAFGAVDAYFAPVCMRLRSLRAAGVRHDTGLHRPCRCRARRARLDRRRTGRSRLPRLRRALPQAPMTGTFYVVGGAVRDALLGRSASDRDWVVVGSTPEALLAAGYRPVGKDFPVFLHPETGEEVALARTERKSAPGYHGFTFHADPGVTLEQDLARRDLTINAIAQAADGRLIDPYGGQRDLAGACLPPCLGGLRRRPGAAAAAGPAGGALARLQHRARNRRAAARRLVDDGEVDALVPERVWQELSRGLMETRPSRMFEVLRGCGALARLLPEVDRLWGVPQPPQHHPEVDTGVHLMLVLDQAAAADAPLPVRYACLVHDLGKGTTPPDEWPRHIAHEARSAVLARQVGERWRVPGDCRELGDVVAREHGNVHRSGEFNAAALLRLLERCDAIRRPERFAQALLACECDARGRTGLEDRPYPQRARLATALHDALAVDTAAIAADAAARGLKGPAIGAAVQQARVEAVEAGLRESGRSAPSAG